MGRPAIVETEPIPLPDRELTARLFRALGDSTRLTIIESLLAGGPQPQKQIVKEVGLSQGRVSQHLACLTWCGFLEATKDGREVYYKVATPRVGALLDLAKMYLDTTEGDIGSCRIVG